MGNQPIDDVMNALGIKIFNFYLVLIFVGGITIRLLLLSLSRCAIEEITSGGFITNESSSLVISTIKSNAIEYLNSQKQGIPTFLATN